MGDIDMKANKLALDFVFLATALGAEGMDGIDKSPNSGARMFSYTMLVICILFSFISLVNGILKLKKSCLE